MAARKIDDLGELLAELGRARSLRGRLRVLGHAWSLLRSLSPSQREQVALRLGSDWAWQRVERAFRADGEPSESERLVGRAFERLRESDPAELRALAGTLKEGGAAGARDLLLMTLTEALEEEADEEEAGAGSEASPPAGLEVVADAGAVLASTLAQRIRAHEPEETAPLQPRIQVEPAPIEPAIQVKPAPIEPAIEVKPAPIEPAIEVKPAPIEPAIQVEPAPIEVEPVAAPAPPAAPGPIAPKRQTGDAPLPQRPLEVLRQLTRSAQPGAELGRAGRERLLEALGGGWASRRALSRMISARSLDDLDEALGLARRLTGPSQQVWCLADLLAHWPLEASEVALVLDAAPSEPARRRLEGRWRRAQTKGGAQADPVAARA